MRATTAELSTAKNKEEILLLEGHNGACTRTSIAVQELLFLKCIDKGVANRICCVYRTEILGPETPAMNGGACEAVSNKPVFDQPEDRSRWTRR